MGAIDKAAEDAAKKKADQTPVQAALSNLQAGLGKPPAPGDSGPGGTAPVAPKPIPPADTRARDPNAIYLDPSGKVQSDPFGKVNPDLVLTPPAEPIKPKINPVPAAVGISGPEERVPAVTAAGPDLAQPVQPSADYLAANLGNPVMAANPAEAQEQQKAHEIIQEAKADPKIGDKLLQLAQDTGRSILELVQGFAKGYSGSDIPLASQVRQEQAAVKEQQQNAAEQAQKERDFQIARDKADQDFQMRIQQIQSDYQDRRFSATTKAEKDAAEAKRQADAVEAQKDRDTQLKIAGMQTTFQQQGRTLTREGGLSDALAQIAKSLQGQ